ncbi:MAG: CDC27 family protein [Chitinophagaceae bacterium]
MRQLLLIVLATASSVAFTQNDSSSFYVYKGLQEKQNGRLMEAYKAFDKAYTFNTDAAVLKELAAILYDLKKYPQAREKYLLLEKLGDKSLDTYNKLLALSFNMRQYPDAIKYAQLVKKTDPTAKTAFYIGKAHYDEENYGEAIRFLNIAATEDPANAEVPYMVARSYADMMNYKMAMPFFEKALSLDSTNNRWMYETGLMYYAMHNDKAALKYLLMAADKGYKRDNEYLENLAIAYLGNKQTDKGLEILRESLKRRPSDANLLNVIAEASYEAKQYDEAIGYWDQLLVLDKENATALFMIGMSYQKKGDKQKGQAICDKAIQLDPSLAKNKQKMSMPGGL